MLLCYSAKIVGVIKITKSVVLLDLVLLVNSQPKSGMSPKSGTLRVWSVSREVNNPPMTTVWPFFTRTSVEAARVVVSLEKSKPELTKSEYEGCT